MPRYIDAEKLKWDYAWFGNSKSEQYRHMKATFDRYVDGQPTADVVERKDLDKITEAHEQIGYEKGYRDGYAQAKVEVVRCKDCRWWDNENNRPLGYCHAAKHCHYSRHWEIQIYRTTEPDFFCKDGERRGNE